MSGKREFLSFLAVGAGAAAINWLSRIALSTFAPLGVAIVAAHLVGMAFAYLGARAFAFRSSGRASAAEAGRYALVNVVSLGQTWAVTVAGLALVLRPLGIENALAEALAHGFGVASTALTSYWLHKHFTFARREGAA